MLLKHYLLKAGVLINGVYRIKGTWKAFCHCLCTWIKRKGFKQKQEPNPEAWLVLKIPVPCPICLGSSNSSTRLNELALWPLHPDLSGHPGTLAHCQKDHYSMLPEPFSFCSLYLKESELSRIESTTGEGFQFAHLFGLEALFFKLI